MELIDLIFNFYVYGMIGILIILALNLIFIIIFTLVKDKNNDKIEEDKWKEYINNCSIKKLEELIENQKYYVENKNFENHYEKNLEKLIYIKYIYNKKLQDNYQITKEQ